VMIKLMEAAIGCSPSGSRGKGAPWEEEWDEMRCDSTRTEAPLSSLSPLDLEESIEELFSESGDEQLSESGETAATTAAVSICSPCGGGAAAVRGLGRSWRPSPCRIAVPRSECEGSEDGGVEDMLTGEVQLTAEGAVPITPCTTQKRIPVEEEVASDDDGPDDWLSLCSADSADDEPAEAKEREQAVLLPLLTPSNTKLCAALVDAFLPPFPESIDANSRLQLSSSTRAHE